MSRDWHDYLADMRLASERVSRYVGGREREAFLANEMAYDAAVRSANHILQGLVAFPEGKV